MDTKTATGRLSVVEQARRAISQEGTVDVVELADRLGLSVYQKKLPDRQSGYIEHANGTTCIIVNTDHPLTRQRFTIAHELGHYVYDYDELVENGRMDRDKSKSDGASEIKADKYAAAILMPGNAVKSFIDKLGSSKIDAVFIDKVAEHFRVSRAMAILRLREIGVNVPYVEFA